MTAAKMERDSLAFAMICAWNGCTPDQAPAEFRCFTDPWSAAAWQRVAAAAEEHHNARIRKLEKALQAIRATPAEQTEGVAGAMSSHSVGYAFYLVQSIATSALLDGESAGCPD